MQDQAGAALPRFLADYVDGGAGQGAAIARNRRDLDAIELLPRPLEALGPSNPAIRLLGQDWSMPVALAPTGLNDLLHPQGDLVLARAARNAGIPFVRSTASLTPPAALARVGLGGVWQQIYVHDRTTLHESSHALSALAAPVIVVTVDVPIGGVRWHERRLPPSLSPDRRTILAALRRPGWLGRQVWARATGRTRYQQRLPRPILDRQFDVALAWDDLAALRRGWDAKLLIKGLLHPDDVCRAQDIGYDGVVLSNHGGRQLESAASAWSMLGAARSRVGTGFTLLADGGVRTGEDVVKAVASGADAVLIGRLALWALAAGGAALLARTLADLCEQTAIAMQLTGCRTVAAVTGDLVRQTATFDPVR